MGIFAQTKTFKNVYVASSLPHSRLSVKGSQAASSNTSE